MHRRSPATTLLLSSFWNISDASDPTVTLCFCRVLWAEDIHPRSNRTWYTNRWNGITNSHEWGFRETGNISLQLPRWHLNWEWRICLLCSSLRPDCYRNEPSRSRAAPEHPPDTTRGAARRSRPAREPLPTTLTVFLRFSGGYYWSSHLWS